MENIKQFKQFFETDEGKKCFARLIRHANFLVRRYAIATGRDLGPTGEDAVMEAIESVLDGRRKWDSERVPNIENFLKWVIRSIVDHSFKTAEGTKTGRYAEDCEGEELVPSVTESEINSYTEFLRTPTPEEQILSEEELTGLNAKILLGLVDDPELEDLAVCFMEGISKLSEIAKELNISTSEINNRKKRLRRKLKEIYDKP